jgi:hypothetical protein
MIDKKPAVGRILVLESNMRHGFFVKGGKILRLTNKSVVIEYPDWLSEEWGTRTVRTFAAVCDTEEEEARLLAFGKQALIRYAEFRNELEREAAALFDADQ